jgi:hypothetical protein
LPRRLGDSPLTRAKKGTARAHTAETHAAATAAPDSRVSSRKSSNDVFFQRRAEEDRPIVPSKQQDVTEAPETKEISEISEIPALREATIAPAVQSAVTAAVIEEVSQAHETAQEAETPPIPVTASPENSTPIEPEGAMVVESATLTEPVLERSVEPSGPLPGPETPDQRDDQPQPEKSGGFFKRLFGRLGK